MWTSCYLYMKRRIFITKIVWMCTIQRSIYNNNIQFPPDVNCDLLFTIKPVDKLYIQQHLNKFWIITRESFNPHYILIAKTRTRERKKAWKKLPGVVICEILPHCLISSFSLLPLSPDTTWALALPWNWTPYKVLHSFWRRMKIKMAAVTWGPIDLYQSCRC